MPTTTAHGARKVWCQLRREGHRVARCTVERLMRQAGLVGAMRGKKVRTTVTDPARRRAGDRVNRDFTAARPNRTWCADFSYVAAWCGVVYVAFVVDVFSRAIVGWSAATNKRTPLVRALRKRSKSRPQRVRHRRSATLETPALVPLIVWDDAT